MDFASIGGEFGLIARLARIAGGGHPDLIVGIGDDAAVLRVAPEPQPYLLVTTDLLVEDVHFTRRWSSAEQIGIKAAECNVSDIAAMGGSPTWMFVSLVVGQDTDPTWCEGLYRGLAESARRHGVVIAGGDTTRGAINTINITLLGQAAPHLLRLRSNACPGDLLTVTGPLGASAAGLAILKSGGRPSDYLLEKHLTPRCRLDVSGIIAPFARAMIDISDGLASEVRHICKMSNVGAQIEAAKIPLHHEVRQAGAISGIDPLEFALGGGEDFELLFTITADNLDRLVEKGISCFTVGRILAAEEGTTIVLPNGERRGLSGGFDHFA